MIRAIDNVLYSRYKKELTHNNNQEPVFQGKERVFIYKNNFLTLDGRKFSGEVSRELSDGSELHLKYLKGRLQNAQKLIRRFIDVLKFNTKNNSHTFEKMEIEPKIAYCKKYNYDPKGELIGVTRNNIGVFHKRYRFNGLSQTEPIIKDLNHGDISIYYDLQERPVYYSILSKHLSGVYTYDGAKSIERRLKVSPNKLKDAIIDHIRGIKTNSDDVSMVVLTKEIEKDYTNFLDSIKITNCDDEGRPVETVVKNILDEPRYTMTYEYNKRGNLYKRVTHNDKYKFEEYLNKDKIAVLTRLLNSAGGIIAETKRDLFRNTNIMFREFTKHNYLNEHITLEIEKLFDKEVNTYTTKIIMPNNASYKRVTKVDNLRNGVLEDKFYDNNDKEINPTIYLNLEQMISKLKEF